MQDQLDAADDPRGVRERHNRDENGREPDANELQHGQSFPGAEGRRVDD